MRKYIVTSKVVSENIVDETVIINLDSGSYYNLNAEAGKIWSYFIQGCVDIDLLKSKITSGLNESENAAIESFISKLIDENLIKETDKECISLLENNISIDTSNLILEVYVDMQDLLGLDPIHEVDPEVGWPVQQKPIN